jgi:two-component system repressor protein LuxO
VVPVALPPLRERGEDVMLLAEAFLARSTAEEAKRFTRFAPDAAALLRAHRWPGNVRELENAIRTAVVLHDGEAVTAAMLPVTVHGGAAPGPAAPAPRPADPARRIRPLAEVEREAIEEAIRLCGGNVPKAAAFLGVSPSTLYRKREAWAQRG